MARRGKKDYVHRHIRLHHWLMRSAAWRSLKCEARALVVALYELYNGSNNGALFLSIREAARRINTSKSTAAGAFRVLMDRGFIRPNVKGAFSMKQRHATSWVLTEFEFAGQLATKDFMRWRTMPEIQNTVRPQGQMVRVEGQIGSGRQEDCSICPSSRTDKPGFSVFTVPPEGHR
jgi:hypothetical protein